MRKTRLVLIPGVKSLDTIGCLLLFLACPTIAFKGQENREIDTICQSQNLKEFWVDSPWPGDTDNKGWTRGYGGGNWPGNSQNQNTCNALTTRSVVKSRISDDRRVQARRDVSRDDGTDTRKIRLNYDHMRRDMRRDVDRRGTDRIRNIRDSRGTVDRKASEGDRRIESTRMREDIRESRPSARSLDREIRSVKEFRDLGSRTDSYSRDGNYIKVSSTERRIITKREVIDGNRNAGASARHFNREIRYKREVAEPDTRRAFLKQERTDTTISAERRTVSNREVIDEMRDSRRSIQSLNRADRRARTVQSRQASVSRERTDSRFSDERMRAVERRNVENRLVGERTSTRLSTRSVEREVRSERNNRDLLSAPGSRLRERIDRKIPDEMHGPGSIFSSRSMPRETRSDIDIRTLESRLAARINSERRQPNLGEKIYTERRAADNRRVLEERREPLSQNQRRSVKSERESHHADQVRDRMSERIRIAERQTSNSREITDAQRRSLQAQSRKMYEREEREPEGHQAIRQNSSLHRRSHNERRRELGNRQESRLLTRSLDRRTRTSERDARESERREDQEKDSRRSAKSVNERRTDIRRELERVNRRPARSIDRETRLYDAQKVVHNNINELRRPQETVRIHLQRRAAMNTRESRRTAEENRRTHNRIERDSREAHSHVSARSAEERAVVNIRLPMERRNSRLSAQSLERTVQSAMERLEERSVQDMRGSRMDVANSATRELNRRIADGRRDFRTLVRSVDSQQTFSGRDTQNRRTKMESTRTRIEGENRNIERVKPGRVSRRVAVVSADERLVRGERQRRSTRSAEGMRKTEMRFHRGRDADDEGKLSRFSRRSDERLEMREGHHFIRSPRLSRSSDDVSRFDRQIQLGKPERDTMRMDMRRLERDRLARHSERASQERMSRVDDADRIDNRLARGTSRIIPLTRSTIRGGRSVGDFSSDGGRRESRIADHQRREAEREPRVAMRTSAERLSRLIADAERAYPRREQTRLRREIRSLEDIRDLDRRTRSARNRRETVRADTRHGDGEIENRSTTLDRATPGRINRRLVETQRTTVTNRLTRDESRSQRLTQQRELRSTVERRAVTERQSGRNDRRENGQRLLTPADFRRVENRDSRELEIKRISKDISQKFESIRSSLKEARRSDRQRRVGDVERDLSDSADRRRDNAFTTASNRRLTEYTDLTNDPRRFDVRERLTGKTNAMEREYRRKFTDIGNDNFFESSKNALASWLTTDISRTDLNGIAETLMYGGIACFALFSNVNKKVIF